MTNNSKWVIDPAHSQVQFKVRHLGITNVNGKFNLFKGEVHSSNDDFTNAQVRATINSASIDTSNGQRDTHLKSADFLDAEKFPDIKFEGLLLKEKDGYKLAGDVTIREVKKYIEFETEFNGVGTGRFGDKRSGFEAKGVINRKDFGLTWNILAEGGGLVVGDEIKFGLDIQVIKEAAKV
jgi:polyisoprenoid-binding protein YceI